MHRASNGGLAPHPDVPPLWHGEPGRGARLAGFGLAVAIAALLSGCSSVPPTSPSPSGPVSAVYRGIYETAQSEGASEDQLNELRTYMDGRPIPFSVVEEAVQRTFACLDANGLEYQSNITETYSGYYYYEFFFRPVSGEADEAARLAGNACADRESTWIALLYDNQPGVIEAIDQAYLEQRPELLLCLREHGVDVEDDATRDEVKALAMQLQVSGEVSEPVCVPPG